MFKYSIPQYALLTIKFNSSTDYPFQTMCRAEDHVFMLTRNVCVFINEQRTKWDFLPKTFTYIMGT